MGRYTSLTPSELERMTPAETRYVERKIDEEVQAQAKFHLNLAVNIMRASGARVGI